MNTPTAIVPGPSAGLPPPDVHRRRRWLRRWWWLIVVVTLTSIITTVFVVSLVVHVPYVIESPGSAQPVQPLITAPAARSFPTNDQIDLVTVTVDTNVTLFDKWRADHTGEDNIVPAKQVLGTQTPADNDRLNQVLMSQSKDSAVLVALEKLGYIVTPTQTGALIEDVEKGSPADGVIQIGDTIVAVDGQPVASSDQLVPLLGGHKPGDKVTISIEDPNGQRHDATVTLGNHPDKPGTGFLGVTPGDRLSYPSLPFDVSINSQQIGGPSAGLAFTLGLLDQLTPGDLTGGKHIAATGTIAADGTVGEIGGIQQKVAAVHNAHVPYFLVPIENAADAKKVAPSDVQIVPVHTIDDALTFLQSIGGSGLPAPVQPPAAG